MDHTSNTSNPPRITPVPDSALGPPALVQAIAQRRGGTLLNLDRMLLRSPVFASGWNGFMGAIRTQLSLDPCLRELAICMVAVETDAAYEWSQHAPEFLAAGGSQAQLDALQGDKPSANTQAFNATERAVIALAQAMTRDVRVDDAVFAAVQALLPDAQQQVELVGVIASYNMVSRFLVALQVPMEADMPGASA